MSDYTNFKMHLAKIKLMINYVFAIADNQCHVARKQCEDKFDEKIKDGTVEKLGWCQ